MKIGRLKQPQMGLIFGNYLWLSYAKILFMADLIRNKKAGFKYEILRDFEAGLELLGTEVKSIKSGKGSLDGSHVIIRGGEAFLIGSNIPAYQEANAPQGFDAIRIRKILLSKKEIREVATATEEEGLTAVPISMYNKGNKVKCKIALVRGKKKFDKRESIKKRDTDRDLRRSLKR